MSTALQEQIKNDKDLYKFISSQTGRIKEFDSIDLPKTGEQIHLVSDQAFNAVTFLSKVLEKHTVIDELILSYYSFNIKVVKIIEALIEKSLIKSFYFQTSNLRKYGADSKIPKHVSSMIKKYGPDIVAGSFVNSHAKVMLCKTGREFYSFEGSGNMSLKIRLEQFTIDNSEYAYKFHSDWIKNYHKLEPIK